MIEPETEFPNVSVMSPKELAMETIKDLPENASWQEIEALIHFSAPSGFFVNWSV